MNATQDGDNTYIGNGFVTSLSKEDWDFLCTIKTPCILGKDSSIIYEEFIPKEMQVKYAKIILNERDNLTTYEKALSDARHKMWKAENDLSNITELLIVLG